MSHSTVAHRWFHQIGNKTTGENAYSSGNMFYRNRIIYSYGHHFALAIRFDNVVLYNIKGYSVSTSRHKLRVSDAIDNYTHEVLYVPFKEAYRFRNNVDFKEVYKYIDFDHFVREFKYKVVKLGKARNPEPYLNFIEDLKAKLEEIFAMFRGSKTYALKHKGMRRLLNFEFTPEVKEKMKRAREKQLAREAAERKARKKIAQENLLEWEVNDKVLLNWNVLSILGLNTIIRVKGDQIETSKGVKIDLSEGLRVFRLWEAGKAIGTEINTMSSTWKCTKANGTIKFGCHVIDYNQAKRVLTPYL